MIDPTLGVQTGFKDLDYMTLGLQSGEMTIIGGRPSMGKTSFLLQLAWQVDAPALVISAEIINAGASICHANWRRRDVFPMLGLPPIIVISPDWSPRVM